MITTRKFTKHPKAFEYILFVRIAIMVFFAAALASCSTRVTLKNINAHEYFSTSSTREYYKDDASPTNSDSAQNSTTPKLGLALAGGGSKAASFSIGVLAGLNDARILDKVDIISSVSGGSYAAYFYYSKLLNADRNNERPGQDDWFNACLTTSSHHRFGGEFDCADAMTGYPLLTRRMMQAVEADTGKRKYPDDARVFYQRICPTSDVDVSVDCINNDFFKNQNHLAGYLDFLNNDFDYQYRTEKNTHRAYLNAAKMFFETLRSLPAHWLCNGLFDWRIDLSPSRQEYQAGIERAYGYSPSEFSQSMAEDGGQPINQKGAGGKRGVDTDGLRAEIDAQTFEDLRKLIIKDNVPLWIINTTSTQTGPITCAKNDTLRDSFEITPFGYGSFNHQFYEETMHSTRISDTVVASAAFLDFQQSNIAFPNLLLRVLNLYWGKDIKNPSRSDKARYIHKILPFPFYIFDPGFHRSLEGQFGGRCTQSTQTKTPACFFGD